MDSLYIINRPRTKPGRPKKAGGQCLAALFATTGAAEAGGLIVKVPEHSDAPPNCDQHFKDA